MLTILEALRELSKLGDDCAEGLVVCVGRNVEVIVTFRRWRCGRTPVIFCWNSMGKGGACACACGCRRLTAFACRNPCRYDPTIILILASIFDP